MASIPETAKTDATRKMTRGPYRTGVRRRDQLVAVAVDVFAEHGYAGGSIRAIAEKAGVSHATLILHFGSKEGLLTAVLAEWDRRTVGNGAEVCLRKPIHSGRDVDRLDLDGQHLCQNAAHFRKFPLVQHNLRREAAEPARRQGPDLLGNNPTAPASDVDPVYPSRAFDGGQRQDADELAHRQLEMELRGHHKRRTILPLLATPYRIEVDEPDLPRRDLRLGHEGLVIQSSLMGASAAAKSSASARYADQPSGFDWR